MFALDKVKVVALRPVVAKRGKFYCLEFPSWTEVPTVGGLSRHTARVLAAIISEAFQSGMRTGHWLSNEQAVDRLINEAKLALMQFAPQEPSREQDSSREGKVSGNPGLL